MLIILNHSFYSIVDYLQPSDSWVTVHNLKSLSDGGILDPDDRLNDVADDREQVTACLYVATSKIAECWLT